MKVFLLKDIERIGIAGEIVKVKEGFGLNFLIPRKLGIEITSKNQDYFKDKIKKVEHRKDVVSSKTSMLAEKIRSLKLQLKSKTHDGGKLFGSVSPGDVVSLLAKKGIAVSKNQIVFGKSIKSTGTYKVTIKLSSKLQPTLSLNIVSESV